MNEERKAHGQKDPSKPGPREKPLVEATILGKAVGRDRTVVPPDQVYELAAIGCTDGEIARFFGVKEDTLRYNFAEELEKGREYVKIRLRRAMFKNACDNMSAAVQIFLAKNILGMSDQPLSTEANAPLPWNETDDTEMDLEENANEEN
jgi:DNA-binding CsgD family transcriptional regulator